MQDASQILSKAMQLHQGGHASAAKTEYLRVLKREPRNADAAHLLGLLLLDEGQADEALPYLDNAVEAAPGISGFLSTRAVALVYLGRLDAAIADYGSALAISPDDAGLNYNCGLALAQKGDFQSARKAFSRAVSLKPDFAEAYGNLGIAHQELGEAENAVAAFEQALALQPDSPVHLNNLGLALQESGRANDALKAFELALQLDSGNAQALCNKGNLLSEMNDWSTASSAYSAALAQVPDLAEAHFGLGYVAFRTGDAAVAASRLSECIRHHPGDARALAYLSLVQGSFDSDPGAGPLVDFSRYPVQAVLDIPEWDLEDLRSHVRDHPSLKWEPPGKSTRTGSQTARMDEAEPGPVGSLAAVLRSWLDKHLKSIAVSPEHPHFFRVPETYALAIWATVLVRQGRQLAHIHPNGWLSGVVYLTDSPVADSGDDPKAGCFEIGRFDPEMEPRSSSDSVFVSPKPGRVVVFPSYYFHRTVPFEAKHERISIAFDVEPMSYRYE
ncbi:MAG: tetratricopeptide repeat protein [Albidovulum sp.]|nr:tetratricopeptide repeat protein [Albidovulum sp.]